MIAARSTRKAIRGCPFGYGGSGGAAAPAAASGGPKRFRGETADLSDIFEGLFGGAQQRSGGFGGFGGFGTLAARPRHNAEPTSPTGFPCHSRTRRS
jgi:hypothetical protein